MDDTPDATPNARLAHVREQAGYSTASEAARAFGWNENTYRSHENGERGIRTDTAQKYARAFRTSPGYILFGFKKKKIGDEWDRLNDAADYYKANMYKRIAGYIDNDGSLVEYPVNEFHGHKDFFVETDILIAESNFPIEIKSKSPIIGCFPNDLILISTEKVEPRDCIGKLAIIEVADGSQHFRRVRTGPDPSIIDVALHPDILSDYRRVSEVRLVSLIIQSSFWRRMSLAERDRAMGEISTSTTMYDFRRFGPDGPVSNWRRPHE